MKLILTLFAIVILGFAAYVRFAPSDPESWHTDPLSAKKPRTPNAFLMLPGTGKYPSPEYAVTAAVLARAFDDLALSHPNVSRLAGGPASLFTTYIARTPLMAYPDYISVRAIDLGNGRAALAVFSRARFGYSDRGLNRKRLLGWLKKLQF